MNSTFEKILNPFSNRIIAKRTLPERKPKYVEIPDGCNDQLKRCLQEMGFSRLYSHQADFFEKSVQGKNLVITTGTASGKSLAFYLPVINELLQNPSSRAIFIYPTKALTQDQYKGLLPFMEYFGRNMINAGVYDGDTPPSTRRQIRESANIILTNPDMINASFLPNHNRYGFPFIFRNLKFLVIDEIHVYRGVFGSQVSNVIRRLIRVTGYHQNVPQFLCSSATIANPLELTKNICHKDFELISKDGSPASEKEVMFWQPPWIDNDQRLRRSPIQEMISLLPKLVESDQRFIAFCLSRNGTEVVTKESRDTLSSGVLGKSLSEKISGYRGGFTPEERHRIEKGLANGNILGVVSTNALELGIDIGTLDIAVLGGFPRTRASFWQQIGRAGRSRTKAYAVLILGIDPTDQFIAIKPDWLMGESPENAVVDNNNIYIMMKHIRAAAAELPLTIDDLAVFPEMGEVIPFLMDIGELREINDTYHWVGTASPAQEISLRNISNDIVQVYDDENEITLTQVDLIQAKHELYPGAIYLHDTNQYKCVELNLDTKIAHLVPCDLNYFTEPFRGKGFRVINLYEENDIGLTLKYFGFVNVKINISAYKMIQFYSHQILGFENLEDPLSYDFDTEAFWIGIPDNVCEVLKTIVEISEFEVFESIKFSVLAATSRKVMAGFSDTDGGFLGNNEYGESGRSFERFLIIYDNYPGGLGFSEKGFIFCEEIIRDAIDLVSNCKCKNGCPSCIGPHEMDKSIVLWVLKNLFEESPPPNVDLIPKKTVVTQNNFLFDWDTLEEDWAEIVEYLLGRNLEGAPFLKSVKSISKEGATLTLHIQESAKKLFDNENIKKRIKNNFSMIIDLPENFLLVFSGVNDKNRLRKRDQLSRHLSDNEN